MAFTAISDILKYKEENNCKFWEAIVQQEAKDFLVDEIGRASCRERV